MSYSNNHYNYQIAVIFAILVGGLLLLAIVVGGIYFVCVNNMRGDDKKRLASGRSSAAAPWPVQAPSYTAPYRDRPASATLYNPPPQQQSYDFVPRSPIESPNVNMNNTGPFNQQYANQQQYSQVPLVTSVPQDYINSTGMRPQQPDVIYTQGPSGYIQSTPVEYTMNQPTPAYHQSSV